MSIKNVLRGASTILELMPKTNKRRFLNYDIGLSDTSEALYSDWCVVGSDLKTAAQQYRHEKKSKQQA